LKIAAGEGAPPGAGPPAGCGKRDFIPGCVQMVVFVAAGFSLRCTGETPVPPRKGGRKIFDWSQLGIKGEPGDKSRPEFFSVCLSPAGPGRQQSSISWHQAPVYLSATNYLISQWFIVAQHLGLYKIYARSCPLMLLCAKKSTLKDEVLARDATRRGLGLAALHERARMLGGSMEIWSRPGASTRITCNISVNQLKTILGAD